SSLYYLKQTYFLTLYYETCTCSGEYVAKYRINYALTLLQSQENWTLDAISNSCGFKSINTFKKYFMDYVGSSPCVYRTNSI
ncbi:AraC family transcriptional regulator, partial [Myroides marinus]|uniref:helix-turn-helix domain-containing protein n=1 Tax=Myroides marinus TaxID=703342 RepID=UPI002577CFE9